MLTKGLSEAYERLKLSHNLALAISESSDVEGALAATLRLFVEAGGWAFGQVWVPDESGQALRCGPVWYAVDPTLERFRKASLKIHFRPGEPLLGMVWQDGKSRWADELHLDVRSFLRADAAMAASLRAALVVPVCSNGRVLAVLEFLTREQAPQRAGVHELIDAAAAQLSSLMAQKEAEARLRRSEARFRAVAETATDAIVSVDNAGTIIYVNPGAAQLFGYDRADMMGEPVTMLIPDRFRADHADGFKRFLRTREGRLIGKTVLVCAYRRDGSEVPIELSLATWQEESAPYFSAIIRDVSKRQQMQVELEQALEDERTTAFRLRGLDQAKNTLLDAVAHDLRGPLAALRATAMVLQGDAEQPRLTAEERREYLAAMKTTMDKMRRVLDDLLNVEAFKSGQMPFRLESVDLSDLVRRTLEEHRSALGDRPINCSLPAVYAEVDAAKIERIVENLLVNASRHTPKGATVEISVKRRGGHAVICIDDTGPGVPEEMRTVIFERLRKQPGSSREGLGMGLSLVARLAEWHGGRAWVEGRSGGGAAFRVAVPGCFS